MKRRHARLTAVFLLACVGLSHAQTGSIYKCTVKGATVYRDQPCSPGKPEAGRLSKPDAPPVIVNENQFAALMQGIRRLERREREQHAQYDREADILRARMPIRDAHKLQDMRAVQQQDEQLLRTWQQRFAETRRQRQALIDRLRKLCPHGASSGSGKKACHR